MPNSREYIILHHSDILNDGKAQLDRINESHKARGFPLSKMGYYVGYHYVCGFDGTIKQTRGLDETGAHSLNCGSASDLSHTPAGTLNYRSIGICCTGDFTREQPTAKQVQSLMTLLMQLQNEYSIPDDKVLLHREVKATSCPGTDLRAMAYAARKLYFDRKLSLAQHDMETATGYRKTFLDRLLQRLMVVIDRFAKPF